MDIEFLEIVEKEYADLTSMLIAGGVTVSTMESCTAGLIATLLTDTEGASGIMKGAFITYSNEAKIREGVPEDVIRTYGVYSEETARAMAEACARAYDSWLGIGVTGSIGRRDPANPDSVPGEVYFALKAGEELRSYSMTIEKADSRLDAKLQVAHVVCLMLNRILI